MAFLLVFLVVPFLIGSFVWIKMFGQYQITHNSNMSTKDWHFMYMQWALSPFTKINEYTFRGLCNYAWALYAVITFSFVFITIKLLGFILSKLLDLLSAFADRYETYCSNKLDQWTEKNLASLDKTVFGANKLNKFLQKFLYVIDNDGWYGDDSHKNASTLYYRITPEQRLKYKERLEELKKEMELARQAEAERRAVRAEKRKKSLAKWSIIAKNAMKVIAVGVVGIAAYYVFLAAKWVGWFLFVRVNWPLTLQTWFTNGLEVGEILLWIVGIIVALAAIIYGIQYLWCTFGKYCIPCEEKREALGKFFIDIGSGIIFPFVWIGKGIVFAFRTIRDYKEDNCPMIEWD